MNAIEQRFYNSFLAYIKGNPKASIHSDSWEMKIAEYSIEEKNIVEENEYIGVSLCVLFPSLPKEIRDNNFSVYLNPQSSIGNYTVDFELYAEGFLDTIVKIAIEIDGHDFHEKTKEQAGYDKRRDREISMRDYTVLRFTGSEIYNNAMKCVQEVFNILITLTYERYEKYTYWYIDESKQFDKAIKGMK